MKIVIVTIEKLSRIYQMYVYVMLKREFIYQISYS